MTLNPIKISQYSRIVLLTGAGVSAASGLPAFRGPDGLVQDDVQWVSDAANLPESLPGLWKLYGGLRKQLTAAEQDAASPPTSPFGFLGHYFRLHLFSDGSD